MFRHSFVMKVNVFGCIYDGSFNDKINCSQVATDIHIIFVLCVKNIFKSWGKIAQCYYIYKYRALELVKLKEAIMSRNRNPHVSDMEVEMLSSKIKKTLIYQSSTITNNAT